jgi:hypothetical protein
MNETSVTRLQVRRLSRSILALIGPQQVTCINVYINDELEYLSWSTIRDRRSLEGRW